MATNYGIDTYCVTDVPLVDQQVTSPALVIGQRVARRLQTPRGGLAAIGDDPNGGLDVRRYTLKRMSPAELGQAQQQIAAECEKDEEVGSAAVTIAPFVNGGPLLITIQLTSAAGPFSLVLSVTQLTVEAVFNQ